MFWVLCVVGGTQCSSCCVFLVEDSVLGVVCFEWKTVLYVLCVLGLKIV